jgi:hypothetical protein
MQCAALMFVVFLLPQVGHGADLANGRNRGSDVFVSPTAHPTASIAQQSFDSQIDQGQSVEAKLREMDKDRNGLVTVTEVRAYLEAKHGKGYEKALLDKLEQTSGASCGTAFANSFY